MTGLADAALAYAARGWPVFPCTPGAKTPAGQLVPHGVLEATTNPAQIATWWQALPDANVGIATGTPGPDVVDIDVKPDGDGYTAYSAALQAGLLDGAGMIVATPSGGMHAYFTGTGQRNSSIRRHHVDFRGAGGYVVAAPSVVDGRGYRLGGDSRDARGPVDWQAVRVLVDPPPDPQPFRQPGAAAAPAGAPSSGRPGDEWSAVTTWAEILAPRGWRMTRDLGRGRAMWRRPGKNDGSSATTREDGGLYVFSTSTEFDTEVPYTKFGAYAVLEHGGDHSKAAAALRAAGYGTPAEPPPVTLAAPPQPPAAQPDAASVDDQLPRSSWHPIDLTPILNGDQSGDPEPVLLTRSDGKRLFYAGKINALIAESESGKTWIALATVVEALHNGDHVVYLDFEDSAAGIVGRLSSLGATRPQLEKLFHYAAPDEPLTALAAVDLADVLADEPALAVVDGVNAAMTLLGLNLKDNKDATDFSQRILRPLKRTGATVLTVDHVVKDTATRGLTAIGAQAKRADIDGAAYIVEPVQKFGRGQQGKLSLTVSKDRPGHVRAISAGATHAGIAVLTPHDDGTISFEITAPDMRPVADKPPWRPTGFMERISKLLEQFPDGLVTRAIRDNIKGDNKHIDTALEALVTEAHVTRDAGPRNAIVYRSATPYREISERQIHPPADRADRAATVLPSTPARSSDQPSDRAEIPTPDVVGGVGCSTVAVTAAASTQKTADRAASLPDPLCTSCGERHQPDTACYPKRAAL